MRDSKVYSVSNAIIIFAFLLITTPGLDCVCNAGSAFTTRVQCTGSCACPVVSGHKSGEILSQTASK